MDRKLGRLHSSAFGYFLAVAQEGSFRGAARVLNIASSAVNRHILLLEQELGFALFDRHARNLQLTDAGRILLKHCRATVRSFEDAVEELDALRELRSGVVRVAASESFAAEIVPEICAAFSEAYPAIRLHVTVASADAVTASVAADEADVGFAFGDTDPGGVRLVAAFDLEIGAVVGPKHPLAGRKDIRLEECSGFPLVVPDSRLSFRRRIDAVSDLFTSQRAAGVEASSPRLMIGIAGMNRHIAFQTRIGLSGDIDRGRYVFLPLTDRRLKPDRCMIIASARSEGRFAAERFCAHATAALRRKLDSGETEAPAGASRAAARRSPPRSGSRP
jgi:DNA-binding transcriptional LysR family regulator